MTTSRNAALANDPPVGATRRLIGRFFRVPLLGRGVQSGWHLTRAFALRVGLRPAARTYLRRHRIAKLHLGASFKGLPGWFNTDLFPERWPVMRLDAAQPFPLPDASFDFVFSEHMIEHVPLDGARTMLRECFRVLRPGGRIRIATPDLARIVAIYQAPDAPAHRRYLERSVRSFGLARDLPAATTVCNSLFYLHGHRFLFDEPTLTALLAATGFVAVRRFVPGESETPELRCIEVHQFAIGVDDNRLETLVLEACKP